MNHALWQRSALDLASAIRSREISCAEATASVLARIDAVNPKVNALSEVMADSARAAAAQADQALQRGDAVGPLHGVPVSIKCNIDVAGSATDGGIVALKGLLAKTDAPLVAHLRRAGAVIVGRSNAPAFSLRWFTDNDLHGRTLNPWNAGVTPGGSSGGAAAAVALGLGPIAHGNDYGGSIRHPAWACGVVGLRTTAGRVPAFNATAQAERTVSNQLMSVQGPLTRTVADARLALQVMSQGDPRDPLWVPAPIDHPGEAGPLKVALFKRHPAFAADPGVVAALDQAAAWLQAAGCVVEDAQPPHFEEGMQLWQRLVYDDLRRAGMPAIEAMGDAAVKKSLQDSLALQTASDRDGYLNALQRRLTLARDWSLFLEQYPVLLMPVSWQRPMPIDEDTRSPERMAQVIAAQSPLLGTAMLGLPGLAVPTGLSQGLPAGVQLVANRFREDRLLRAGALIERAAGFSALQQLCAMPAWA